MRCALDSVVLNPRMDAYNCPLFICMGVSSKVILFKSLHTKLTNEHTSLEQRASELRDASHTLVRDSGSIGGGLDSNNLDAPPY
jgi:hypothetical protein